MGFKPFAGDNSRGANELHRSQQDASMRMVGVMTVLVVACSIALSAQETTGTITGAATDQTGAVLRGVMVTVKNIDSGFERAVLTNNEGVFTATLPPIGNYELVFELAGFQPATMRGITLHVNDRLQVDGRLTLGGTAESVTVTASSQLMQPIPALQTMMAPRLVQELPLNNRNFVQLVTLAPGVSSDLPDEVGVGLASTISVSINGARRNALTGSSTASPMSTPAPTLPSCRRRAWTRSKSSQLSQTVIRRSGPAVEAASSTSSPSPAQTSSRGAHTSFSGVTRSTRTRSSATSIPIRVFIADRLRSRTTTSV